MKKIAIIAITKNGIDIASKLKEKFNEWFVYAPMKFRNKSYQFNWYSESTPMIIEKIFKNNDGLICIFSLGAVIRLITPYMQNKKKDPAVIVIDDKANFVISVLSGHIGGANEITDEIAKKMKIIPVITTAAEVNKTIPIDILGKKFNWKIDDDASVTKISAAMINNEKISIYQDAGEKKWWENELPSNVIIHSTISGIINSKAEGHIFISDKIRNKLKSLHNIITYRPKTLVVGIGLHRNTSKHTIKKCLNKCMKEFKLSEKSITRFATIKKNYRTQGLIEISKEMKIKIEYFKKEELSKINIPNPSKIVNRFEGTYSVSEASALKSSKGKLIVEKQKFPPDVTIAIARIKN